MSDTPTLKQHIMHSRDGADAEGPFKEGDRVALNVRNIGTIRLTHMEADPLQFAHFLADAFQRVYQHGRADKTYAISKALDWERELPRD